MTRAARWKIDEIRCRYIHGYRYPTLFIACCPKSASTWFSHLLAKLIPGYNYLHPEEFRRPDGNGCDITPAVLNQFEGKYSVGRSHTPAKFGNLAAMDRAFGKYMFGMRDLRDVTVSLYHHMHRYPKSAFIDTGETRVLPWTPLAPQVLTCSKEECLDEIIGTLMPTLTAYVRQWLAAISQRDNCLLLRYEDVTRDTEAELRRVLDFYEISLPERRIRRFIQRYHRSRLDVGKWKFRKGGTGNWRKELSLRQQDALDQLCGDLLVPYRDAA